MILRAVPGARAAPLACFARDHALLHCDSPPWLVPNASAMPRHAQVCKKYGTKSADPVLAAQKNLLKGSLIAAVFHEAFLLQVCVLFCLLVD